MLIDEDLREIGYLRPGSYIRFDGPAGKHSLRINFHPDGFERFNDYREMTKVKEGETLWYELKFDNIMVSATSNSQILDPLIHASNARARLHKIDQVRVEQIILF